MNQQNESIFDRLYAQLNAQQKQAVDTIEGPVIVNAGPGTGKTQILTLRIANILRQQGGDMAENILALTFTNAGVTAMRKRLAEIIGSDAYRVGIFTFHSFAEYIITQYNSEFPHLVEYSLITDVERYTVIEDILRSGDFKILKPFSAQNYYVPKIISAIDELKRDNILPAAFLEWNEQYKQELIESEDSYYKRNGAGFQKGDMKPKALDKYTKNLELAAVYGQYIEQLSAKRLYDFNDMILQLIHALENRSEFQYELQEKYQYLLIDEHQDSNASQNKIIELLSNAPHLDNRPNIFTVGDNKQAIYRFQGASLENFLAFENKFQDVQMISLVENYRSGQTVVDSAHDLISASTENAEHQPLQAQNDQSRVECHEFNTYDDEIHWVAQQINTLREQEVDLSEIAVIYRENRHTDDIRKCLARQEIPSVVLSKENILETPLVHTIILLLQSIKDLTNNRALAELLYSNVFDTQAYDVTLIIERSRQHKLHVFKIIQETEILREIGVSDIDIFISIARIIQLSHTVFATDPFLTALDTLMKESGLITKMIDSPNSQEQLRYYDRLYDEFRTLSQPDVFISIDNVLSHITTLQEYNMSLNSASPDSTSGVRLMTAHKSKGLEYQYVFITNVVDKVWGNKTGRTYFQLPTGTSNQGNDDERRLLYVGITRAKVHCYLSCSGHTREKETVPSQFLYDIKSDNMPWNKHTESISLTKKHAPYDTDILHNSLFDSDYIISLYQKRPLSITALNNFIDCPAKYFINNLLQVPASYSRSLIYGSLMHRALELFFSHALKEQSIPDKQYLLDRFTELVGSSSLQKQEKKEILNKGSVSLSGYFDVHSDDWTYHVENELRISGVQLVLGSNTIQLSGVLDKIEHSEPNSCHVRVLDYKTGKTYSQKNTDQKAALNRQLVFYSLLLNLYRDGYFSMESAVLDFIEPHKETGKYEQHKCTPTDEDRVQLIEQIQAMDEEIRKGSDFLKNRCNKQTCESCNLLKKLV